MAKLNRTKENPWHLKTAPGTSEYTMHVEERDGDKVLACTVGKTVLFYNVRCIDDLHGMLKANGGWVDLGGADEQKYIPPLLEELGLCELEHNAKNNRLRAK